MPGRNTCTVAELWQAAKGLCALCGHPVPLEDASRDHVIPESLGGSFSRRNMRMACRVCNEARGNTFPVGRFRGMSEDQQRNAWDRCGGRCVHCDVQRGLVFCHRRRKRPGRPKVFLACMPCLLGKERDAKRCAGKRDHA